MAINILQIPVVVQEGVVELLEVELLFVTSASAPAAAVLSLLLDSQDIRVKQSKLTKIRFKSNFGFDMYFNFCKKVLLCKSFAKTFLA